MGVGFLKPNNLPRITKVPEISLQKLVFPTEALLASSEGQLRRRRTFDWHSRPRFERLLRIFTSVHGVGDVGYLPEHQRHHGDLQTDASPP